MGHSEGVTRVNNLLQNDITKAQICIHTHIDPHRPKKHPQTLTALGQSDPHAILCLQETTTAL
ncbi:hypothetical protein E2C01_032580 [Portunus trituberculatus]|uniref:Uncharacterized protein n=1 Tax=Portunus trituberculatus TaxID=210409 RepID=A0A5B7EWC6_PORTR|nr:hypothetical protein [Portunus trituberculatus]